MSARAAGFKFIDLPTSAERLGITRNELLQLVAEGRVKPFSGSGQQSVFRASDIERLGQELAAPVAAPAEPEASPAQLQSTDEAPVPPGRARRRDPIKLIGTRLSMDSRWAEISDADIATWLDALEAIQFERVRKVSNLAIERLQRLLAMLDDQENKLNLRSK